jgi:hypothetical protein
MLLIALLGAAWATGSAAQHAQHAEPESPVIELSVPLRAALVEEMQQVDANLQRIVAALPRAEWPAVAEASRGIAASFILKQKLSAEQRAELHEALPEHFLALDARFHDTALRLADAADEKDAELATFYIYKLEESCVSCHAQYALHRFPAFEPMGPTGH